MTLTNKLADLAERVREAHEQAAAAEKTSIERTLDAGALLVEAKATCPHGQWSEFLKRASVHERQARRLMQLARSGVNSDTVSELGGMKATLAWLAARKLPGENEALIGARGGVDTTLICRSADHPGYFDIARMDGEPWVLERPMAGEIVVEGKVEMPIWDLFEQVFEINAEHLTFRTIEIDDLSSVRNSVLFTTGGHLVDNEASLEGSK